MKRVLSLATTGLFLSGLALLPISAHADQTVTGGKDVTPAPAATTMTPHAAPAAVKKPDDKKATVAPASGTGTTTGTTAVPAAKTPAKGAS